MYVRLSNRIWNANLTEFDLPLKAFMDKEQAPKNELVCFRWVAIALNNIFFVVRLYGVWSLI
jgi:hypothetical protein